MTLNIPTCFPLPTWKHFIFNHCPCYLLTSPHIHAPLDDLHQPIPYRFTKPSNFVNLFPLITSLSCSPDPSSSSSLNFENVGRSA